LSYITLTELYTDVQCFQSEHTRLDKTITVHIMFPEYCSFVKINFLVCTAVETERLNTLVEPLNSSAALCDFIKNIFNRR